MRHLFFRPEKEKETELPWFMQTPAKDAKGQPVDKEKELFWKVNKEWRNLSEEQVQALWTKHQEQRNPKKAGKARKNGPVKT